MSPRTLKHRKLTALVIGGRGGIGSAIVSDLKRHGYDVNAPSHKMLDASNDEAVKAYVNRLDRRVDCLVYAAGVNNPKPFEECTPENLKTTLETNTLGFVSAVRACVPAMRRMRFGRIVVLSSLYGLISRKNRLPYALSKHALTGAVQTLSLELAGDGILVNAVSPGFVMTKMTVKNNSPQRIRSIERAIPLKRMATGQDIALAVRFLCSPENTYITGQNIVVDGGYMAGGWQDE